MYPRRGACVVNNASPARQNRLPAARALRLAPAVPPLRTSSILLSMSRTKELVQPMRSSLVAHALNE
eukprot:651144-Pleurochrysis_carterae.AAC.3